MSPGGGCRRTDEGGLVLSRSSSFIAPAARTRPSVIAAVGRSHAPSRRAAPRRVAEDRERLLVRVERLVRVGAAPSIVRVVRRSCPPGSPRSGPRRRRPASAFSFSASSIRIGMAAPGCSGSGSAASNAPGDRGGPVDGLVVQRETVHQDVRQMHGADICEPKGRSGCRSACSRSAPACPSAARRRTGRRRADRRSCPSRPRRRPRNSRGSGVPPERKSSLPPPGNGPVHRDRVGQYLGVVADPSRPYGSLHLGRVPGVFGDQPDNAGGGGDLGRGKERMKVPVQARRVEIPVHHEDLEPVAGQDPRDVGQRHGSAWRPP